jgi:2-polyprenyl-6-methoxyphenol hydroxylase-like FAD-dependent oxidoreductase
METEIEMEIDARTERASGSSHDVLIMGGGLAGLTLAIQIKRARPETSVAVVEKRAGPAPEAAFKVGESSVEVGAHYFRDVIGVDDHLDSDQIRKFGLRFFFPAGDNSDLAQRVEFSTPAQHAHVYTHQIDRGRFENELWKRSLEHGVEAIEGAFVSRIELGEDRHTVEVVRGGVGGERSTLEGRWLVDASGRAWLLKRKLGLERAVGHTINAAWFRLGGGIDIEDWTTDAEWIERVSERGQRKRSTTHLTGEGYWVWLIQLASGPISVGVCADPRFHTFEQINELDRMLGWLKQHEPQLASVVEQRSDQVEDFLTVEDFSYGAKRVFSPQRWCLTGEAGVFLDPLYSPGSDFIAHSNTIITDLIARDLSGEPLSPSASWRRLRSGAFFWISGKAASRHTTKPPPFDVVKLSRKVAADSPLDFMNFIYLTFYDRHRAIYENEYGLLGNAQVMGAKVLFDLAAYWSNLAFLGLHGKVNPDFLASVVPELDRFGRVTGQMADFFREWHALDQREWRGVSVLMRDFQPLHDWLAELVAPFEDDAFVARYRENVELLCALAVLLFHKAASELPEVPGDDVPINALGIGLQPDRWKKDGLFSAPGITLREARGKLPGIEEFFLEEQGALVHTS